MRPHEEHDMFRETLQFPIQQKAVSSLETNDASIRHNSQISTYECYL